MKKMALIVAAALVLCSCGRGGKVDCSVPCRIVDGTIVTSTPPRAPGQQSALGLRCEPLDTVRIGLVGVGSRGTSTLRIFTTIEGARVTAVCDKLPERALAAKEILDNAGYPGVEVYDGEEGYKALCESVNVDVVYICTNWQMHVPIALYAMEHGKHACMEVPAATSLKDCWALVDACERTRRHCMMMENCCYHRVPLLSLNMAQKGVFGEVYFGEGAYIHCLDNVWPGYQDNWRMEFNQNHRGDNYPTHGLGPLCQIFNIHRGDKMDVLVSMDTKSIRGASLAKKSMGVDSYAEGDHIVTLIRTHNGHAIELQHNVYAPRQYSRKHAITGTEGYLTHFDSKMLCLKSENLPDREIFKGLEGEECISETRNSDIYQAVWDEYIHPLTAHFEDMEAETGIHSGRMDYIMQWRLVYCLRHGLPLDQDVYDAAEWSCPVELSRLSLENGYMPVEVPDFTRGDWNRTDGFSMAE